MLCFGCPSASCLGCELRAQCSEQCGLISIFTGCTYSCGLFQDSKTQACEGAVFICHTRAGGEQPWWAQAGPGRNLFCSSAVAVLREGWCRACLPLHTRLVVGQHVVLPWPSFRCLSGWAGRASWPCCTCCAKAALWSTWLLSWALQWEAFVLADVPHGLNVWVSVKSGG